ncbi:MAG: 6-phosphofructokinase, partial [Saprospiraceae bacterium]
KLFSLVVVAEGEEHGGAFEIAKKIQEDIPGFEAKVTIIGHLQRGGAPSFNDRVLASRLGRAGVDALLDGKKDVMVGIVNHEIAFTSFDDSISKKKELYKDLADLGEILAMG